MKKIIALTLAVGIAAVVLTMTATASTLQPSQEKSYLMPPLEDPS